MKPKVYSQLYIQLVFAVKYRQTLFNKTQRTKVFQYVSGIVENLGHKSIIVGGYSDHIHIFLGLKPSISISDTVGKIKKSSSKFIDEQDWYMGKFQWQDGYGAFSYSKSQVENVFNYIKRQEEHHSFKRNFKEEYIDILEKAGIEFDKKYLFDFI